MLPDMFDYDAERLRSIILELTRSTIPSDAAAWLSERLGSGETSVIYTAFSLIPRKAGKNMVRLPDNLKEEIAAIKPGFTPEHWTADRLSRVCLLMHIDHSDQDKYSSVIENLFRSGEMSELAALYSALPLFAYPGSWKMRCAEGIRSNIGTVLEAIMYENPYPAAYLDEGQWNQLIMKAFFTEKDITRIYGVADRANPELSQILSDYAHERWAAGRPVNPALWRVAGLCMSEQLAADLKKAWIEGNAAERREVELVLKNSGSEQAGAVLKEIAAV